MPFSLFICAVLLTGATNIKSAQTGIEIYENIENVFSVTSLNIDGKSLKKFNFPENYLTAGRFPETEFYEKIIYFAAPENSSPKLNFSKLNSKVFNTDELVPSKSFEKGKDGIISEVYKTSELRNDRNLSQAEISFAGIINGMNIYRLVIRPLIFEGNKALLCTNFGLKISFGSNFENNKSGNVLPKDAFEAEIINLDFAKSNPVRKKKQTAENFLDRQTEWIKLTVKEEGIYKITGLQIKNLGIDIASSLCERIKMYSGAGKDISTDPTVPVYHGASEIARKVFDANSDGFFGESDYIIFYAVNTTSRNSADSTHYYNKYSDLTYYWIDLGIGSSAAGRDISELYSGAETYTDISSFQRHEFSETRNSMLAGGETYYWYNQKIDPLQKFSLSVNIKDIDFTQPVNIKVNHSSEISQNLSRIKYSVNDSTSSEVIFSYLLFDSIFKSQFFKENSINKITLTNLETGSPKYFNGYDIIYSGTVQGGASDEYFYASKMTPGSSYRFVLSNSAGKELFDISDPVNVKSTVINGADCVITAEKELGSYLLFSGTYKTPFKTEVFDNSQKKSLHSRTDKRDMVIISPAEFYDFFKNDEMNYIKAHIESGNDVQSIEVVSIEDISNEFGRGYQEPAATRNFIEYAHENWDTEYFLLAGDGNYYLKNEPGIVEKNLIYTSHPSFGSGFGHGSDDFYANLTSNFPAQHVSLGRFTVSNITELRNVVSKTVSFILNKNMESSKAKILLVADDERNPDYSRWYEIEHIRNTENIIDTIVPSYYYCDKLYSTEYPFEFSPATGLLQKPQAQEDLIRKLQRGVNVFCYVGHGAPMQLAHEKLFTPSAFSKVSNYEKYFFMIGATCSFGVFNDPNIKNLAEQMLISPNKGSIGLINSVTGVFSGYNETLVNRIFYAAFFDPLNKLTVGKALKQAKMLYPGENSACFTLFGDPALKFFSDRTIIESEPSVELYTLKLDSIHSTLNTDIPGGVTDINGVLNTMITDSEVRRAYFNDEQWDDEKDSLRYTLPGKIILSAKSTINEGNSITEFILPKDLTYGENKGRILFYGYNSLNEEFTGVIDTVSIKGDAAVTIADSIPPEIKILYNSINYIQGDPVGQNPVVFADIEDENGINTSGGIGHKILMEIDGEKTDITPYFNYELDNYRKGYASYQLVGMTPGEHNIKVSAWDTFNNYNEKTETFKVIEESEKDENWISNLLNYPNPIKSKGTTFGFAVNSQAELDSYSITVYTINGRKVKTVQSSGINLDDQFQQCYWNGKDADNDIPSNGVYIYILRAKFNGGKTINKKGKLIFAR